jgi:hypothetical protein
MDAAPGAPLPDSLRWPLDLLVEAVRTASWVSARALRRDADHFLGDIAMKAALRGPLEQGVVAAGSAVVSLADALDNVSPGAPDDDNTVSARNSALDALEALRTELLSAEPSDRAKHLRISW